MSPMLARRFAATAAVVVLAIAGVAVGCDGSTLGGNFGPQYNEAADKTSEYGPAYARGPSGGTTDQVIDAFCGHVISCAPRVDERRQSATSSSALESCRSQVAKQGLTQVSSGILLAALACMTRIPCAALTNEGGVAAVLSCLRAAGLTALPVQPPPPPPPKKDQGVADQTTERDILPPERDQFIVPRDAGPDTDADLGS